MNDFIIYLITVFIVLGGIDKLIGNKFGLGEKFTSAFHSMGALALSMIGVISLSPVLANLLIPIVTPIYTKIGADPSMFASTVFALDMGGHKLSMEMAKDPESAAFSWVFLGTMMGPTLVFTIPVALNIIPKKEQSYFAKGILIGLVTIPFGCIAGGFLAGFEIKWMIINLLPTIILAILITFFISKFPGFTIKVFMGFSKLVEIIVVIGLLFIMLETLIGIKVLEGMLPLSDSLEIIGNITIVLAGAFPLIYVLQKLLKKPFERLGSKINLNEYSLIGLLTSLAHHVPMFTNISNMDNRGKVINTAFAVSGSFVMGSHLGFVAAVDKDYIVPMIVGKLTAGVLAALIAFIVTKEKKVTNPSLTE
jgi:ethanolamine transporter